MVRLATSIAILEICAISAMYMTVKNAHGPKMIEICDISFPDWRGICEVDYLNPYISEGYTAESWAANENKVDPYVYVWAKEVDGKSFGIYSLDGRIQWQK